jgi:NDP-sugar pyrophosphorylase family protein
MRMGELTQYVAKPALRVNDQSIVSRLFTQSTNFLKPTQIWINVGHNAITMLEALKNSSSLEKARLIYEPNVLGSLNTLCYLHKYFPDDTLVFHGDLVMSDSYIKALYKKIQLWGNESFVIYHKRVAEQARSNIELRKGYIHDFIEQKNTRGSYYSYVNSGIYFFKSSDVNLISPPAKPTQIAPEGLKLIMTSSRLRAVHQSTSERIAVEDVLALSKASRISKKWC